MASARRSLVCCAMIRAHQGFPRTAKMTSERNAKGILAKLATVSYWMRRGSPLYLHARSASVLMLMCVSVIACGNRSLDKANLPAKTAVSNAHADVASVSNGRPSDAASETREAGQATATPLVETRQDHAKPATQAMRTPSAGDLSKHAMPVVDDVASNALLAFQPSPFVDDTPMHDAHRADTDPNLAPAPAPESALAAHESLVSRLHWGLLLAIAALVAVGGLALALLFDNRRHRRLRMAVRHEPAIAVDELPGKDAVFTPQPQKAEGSLPSALDNDAPAAPSEPVFTLVIDDGALPASASRDHIPFSRLDWRYLPGKFDAPEQWAVDSPVDFLPVSLPEQAASKMAVSGFEQAPSAEPVEPMESMQPAVLADIDADTAAEAVVTHSDYASVPASASEEDPLAALFDQLELCAMRDSGDVPALLIERDSDLPQVIRATTEAVPQHVLQTWERTLRQAIADAQSLTLPSLLVSTLLLRADDANPRDAEALYEEAEEWVDLSMTADHEHRAAWEARRLDIDRRRARRMTGAARLLWLRAMQAHYAPQLAQGEPLVLLAWIDVLTFWAQCQFGDAALARYAEAETVCLRLSEVPAYADAVQRCRADVLRQRATIEQGGARLHSLDTAQALTDALYESTPSAANALAVAVTALARGNVLPPAQAKDAYSHALMHAFMAEGDPRWREQALQCRLAVQWAYENLPGMDVQSDVAFKLAERLEALRIKDPDTLHRMAQTYLRHADFARACELCEHAWRSGHATPALLSTWQEACRQWANVSSQSEQITARQQTMRQLSIASAMR
jgi:hypothetical protein